jgi:hypothetical protein
MQKKRKNRGPPAPGLLQGGNLPSYLDLSTKPALVGAFQMGGNDTTQAGGTHARWADSAPALKGEIWLRWEMRPSPLPISALQGRPSVLRASSQCPPFILLDSRITQALAFSEALALQRTPKPRPRFGMHPALVIDLTFHKPYCTLLFMSFIVSNVHKQSGSARLLIRTLCQITWLHFFTTLVFLSKEVKTPVSDPITQATAQHSKRCKISVETGQLCLFPI